MYFFGSCKLSQRGLGESPSRNRFLVHFSPKIRHLVEEILMIFLRILERRLQFALVLLLTALV